MAKRKKRSQKTKDLIENEKVIDLDTEREARRAKLRAEADASRKKRGAKSIRAEVMEEIEIDDRTAEEPEVEVKAKKKRRKPLSLKLKLCIAALVVALIIMLFSMGNIISLKMQEREAKQTVSQLEKEKADLERQVGDLGSQEYIEKQARDWLKMAQQGEIIYDFSDRKDGPGEPTAITGVFGSSDDASDDTTEEESET